MSTNQGDRQAFFRAISGTTTDYNGDFLAAAATDGFTGEFNGVFIEWLQDRTGSSATNLDGLKQEFAVLAGAHNWESVGGVPIILPDCALWIDVSDPSSITKDGSSFISQANDKSSNGKNVTEGTGANQPLFVANVFNGLPTMRFDGINDRLATDGTFAVGSNVTMFVVSKASATDNKQVFIEQTISLAALDGIQFNSRGNRPVIVKNGGVLVRPLENINWMGTDLALGSFVYDGANLDYFLNGTSLEVIAGVITNTTVTDNLYIGGRASSGTINTDGDISEIVIFDRALSTPEMAVMNNYLMPKWGL